MVDYTKERVPVTLSIGELIGLIGHINQVAEEIPKEIYDTPTMSGSTFGVVAKRYKKRSEELYEILNEVWPK